MNCLFMPEIIEDKFLLQVEAQAVLKGREVQCTCMRLTFMVEMVL